MYEWLISFAILFTEIYGLYQWIKQNLKIKTFLGTSQNAVMTQIWIAMIYYLLLSFIKFQTKYSHTLHELTKIFGEIAMKNVNLIEALRLNYKQAGKYFIFDNQLAFY